MSSKPFELTVLWSFVISLMRQMHQGYVRGRWSIKNYSVLAEGLAYLLTLSYFGLKVGGLEVGDRSEKKDLVFGKAPIVLRTVPFFFRAIRTFWDLFLNLTLHFYFIWACMRRFSLCSGNFFIISTARENFLVLR